MIKNNNEIQEYTLHNKVYIPIDYINQNYRYRINTDYISIMTNRNCYTNYNTMYCDCYNYYYKLDLITERYECSISNNATNLLNYNSITEDINYSQKIQNEYVNDKIIMFGIIIVALIFFISLKKGYRYV